MLRPVRIPLRWMLVIGAASVGAGCETSPAGTDLRDSRADASVAGRDTGVTGVAPDAAGVDVGPSDAGAADADSVDSGALDSRPADSGPNDAHAPDVRPPVRYALTVIAGSGGQVSFPNGMVCRNATCSQQFDAGSTARLRATADPGFVFSGWSLDGNCGGMDANPQVPVNYPINCGANFGSDSFDLSRALVRNSPPDIATWPVSARITRLDLGPNGVRIDFTKRDGPGSWPDVPFGAPGDSLEYTLWIVLNINGAWYTSGCIQYWRGLDRNGGPPSQYAQNWYYDALRWAPMTGHQPAVGEMVGFFVAAGNHRNVRDASESIVRERSNVVVVPFPSDAGGVFMY